MKNILITTAHRGVFFAQTEEGTDLTATATATASYNI